jgi:hypothetical protein
MNARCGSTKTPAVDRTRRVRGISLCDDIGQQLIFQGLDPILEGKLLLLETFDGQLIAHGRYFERDDFLVERPVLFSQLHKFLAQLSFAFPLHFTTPLQVEPNFVPAGANIVAFEQFRKQSEGFPG